MCVCMYVHVGEDTHRGQKRARFTGGYEPTDVGAGI